VEHLLRSTGKTRDFCQGVIKPRGGDIVESAGSGQVIGNAKVEEEGSEAKRRRP